MASVTSPSATAAEQAAVAQQESLEEAYVRLSTQLLLHLQRRNTAAALRTAEIMRDVLLSALSSTAQGSDGPGRGGGVVAPSSGADLFHGSPAERLLQLRDQLKTLASAESTRMSGDAGLHEASGSQSASSEMSSGSSTVESGRDDDETDDDAEEIEEVTMVGCSSGPQQRQQQQQQAAAHLLVEALQSWSEASMKAVCASPAAAPSVVSVVASAASSSAKALATKGASKPGAPQPRPPPPRHKVHKKGKANTTVEEACRGPTMPSASSPSPPLPGEGAACNEDDEGLDAEADAVWVRMQVQVVREMDRLAIVRKHR
ncbi:conserved hypothetical protein [Leishmania mexicana MHOM/GT/2001/U1103]|uniref:Uncharacterized protein n=1 Tax=Leishmania mexicana (strain MHOM/GT/2001/U1103) TaxID=929439 RepID=E9AQ85_LEIMU|nr:conserved hypothetical protein [Leishmania mexicana MHOM/GT/2001/U1103]CBZ25104.1 conserved hypothetical protein [Leishmania mexicana MHOM/GT/2001/U1103]